MSAGSKNASRTHAKSVDAQRANELMEALQRRFVDRLEAIGASYDDPGLEPVEWLRDEGRHGGGRRFEAALTPLFNRASVNVSGVHYDDLPEKRLSSATALSVIIHPRNPHGPSMHMHISWTEMRAGQSYWRLMADLNPSLEAVEETTTFDEMLKKTAPEDFEEAKAQGERYFYIPALGRHRGTSHFYLEGYHSDDLAADFALARHFGESVIDCYAELLEGALSKNQTASDEDYARQLDYHTLYLFQVLTLDRGTTSGILVHDQNDLGILASLPSFVNRGLLAGWMDRMEAPQDKLLQAIVETLPDEAPAKVTSEVRLALAQVVREHYLAHPEALKMQARGNTIPPTVQNHGD